MAKSRSSFNEYDIAAAINGHTGNELNSNLLNLMQTLFGVVDRNETFHAEVIGGDYRKADIIIRYRDKEKNVSIKSGEAKIVHQGLVKKVAAMLKDKNISNETIETFLLYHYGDGTTDGTGQKRMNYEEVMAFLGNRIQKANEELNSNKELLTEFADFVLFTGNQVNQKPADAVYHGDYDYGVCVLKEQYIRYMKEKSFKKIYNLHIGPFLFRPHARYFKGEIRKPIARELVDIYCPFLKDDMAYIARNYPSFYIHMKNGDIK